MNPAHSPQYWKVKFAAQIYILTVIILFLVNSALIVGLQVLIFYRFDDPQTYISAQPEYAGCSTLDQESYENFSVCLLRSDDGNTYIVTAEKHPWFDRYRIVKGGTALIGAEQTTYSLRFAGDTGTVNLTVSNHEEISQLNGTQTNVKLGTIRIPFIYVLYSILLIIIEGLAYYGINKLRGK